LREIPATQKDDIKQFKYGLFILLHIECQASFANNFNDRMRDVMEEMGVGSNADLFTFTTSIDAEDVQMTHKIEREVTLDYLLSIGEEAPLEDAFE
jgi:hypothetical protein